MSRLILLEQGLLPFCPLAKVLQALVQILRARSVQTQLSLVNVVQRPGASSTAAARGQFQQAIADLAAPAFPARKAVTTEREAAAAIHRAEELAAVVATGSLRWHGQHPRSVSSSSSATTSRITVKLILDAIPLR